MRRIPLLTGSRVVVVEAADDAEVLAPPPPVESSMDVRAAVRDAVRFPLAGKPLEEIARGRGTATIVVEPPALPVPGSTEDPRQIAIAATIEELDRAGIPVERQTLVVAGGLARRVGPRDIGALVEPEFRRRFRGRVVVHDVEDDLVDVGMSGHCPLRVNRALVETDLLVTVTAAESVIAGGPSALVAAGGAEALRAAGAYSLLETAASQGWQIAVALERELARRVPVLGVSLVLDHPRLSGAVGGYPYEPEAVERLARSRARLRAFSLFPAAVRLQILRSLPVRLTASAVFAGPPSVAHAEALLRSIEARSADLARPVDALVAGVPRTTPHLPREQPNPVLAAYFGLAIALRLWRDALPVEEGGTLVLLSRFQRKFQHPTQQPYRVFFAALRHGRDPDELHEAERAAGQDARLVAEYRAGRGCHPLLPFADWAACQPALGRLGAVVIAGCRDHDAARTLGFVPAHSLDAALEMAHGRAGGRARVGYLLSPPYFPLRVSRG